MTKGKHLQNETPHKKRKADSDSANITKKTKTSGAADDVPSEQSSLFVGNLSWNIDEEWLKREFEEYGEITQCRVITDKDSGRSKG